VHGKPLVQYATSARAIDSSSDFPNSPIERLAIASLRRDGDTQMRVVLDEARVEEYALLMRAGRDFPPVTVWSDGTTFWLSDGFHRLAAAERAGRVDVQAVVRMGSLNDAQWDSYTANSRHGLRPSQADFKRAVVRALRHPYAANKSTNQLAAHLGVPEATLRRWRKGLRSSSDVLLAKRIGKTYDIDTTNIGRGGRDGSKPRRILSEELVSMKASASPDAARLLNVFGCWLFRGMSSDECGQLLEGIVRSINRSSIKC
jgi:DNA-binding transcriptional regulator YiaG